MNTARNYVDIRGLALSLTDLDPEEWRLHQVLRKYAQAHNWIEYSNSWMPKVSEFYEERGLTRKEIQRTLIFRIAQDLGSRLAVAEGYAVLPDYRDELDMLIREHFPSRRAFCKATGLSEDMLSHVLARRKHLAIDTLVEALHRIGYDLHIRPMTKKRVS